MESSVVLLLAHIPSYETICSIRYMYLSIIANVLILDHILQVQSGCLFQVMLDVWCQRMTFTSWTGRNRLLSRLTNWLADTWINPQAYSRWFMGAGQLVLTDWLTYWLTNPPTKWLTGWSSEWLTNWLNDQVFFGLWMTYWLSNDRNTNGWMGWMNDSFMEQEKWDLIHITLFTLQFFDTSI